MSQSFSQSGGKLTLVHHELLCIYIILLYLYTYIYTHLWHPLFLSLPSCSGVNFVFLDGVEMDVVCMCDQSFDGGMGSYTKAYGC